MTSSAVLPAHAVNLSLLSEFDKAACSSCAVSLPVPVDNAFFILGIAITRITTAIKRITPSACGTLGFCGGVNVIVVFPSAVFRPLSSSSISFMRLAGLSSSPCRSTALSTSGMLSGNLRASSPSILSIASGRSFPVMHQ